MLFSSVEHKESLRGSEASNKHRLLAIQRGLKNSLNVRYLKGGLFCGAEERSDFFFFFTMSTLEEQLQLWSLPF